MWFVCMSVDMMEYPYYSNDSAWLLFSNSDLSFHSCMRLKLKEKTPDAYADISFKYK